MDDNKVKKKNLFIKRFFHHLTNNIADGLKMMVWPLMFVGIVVSGVAATVGEFWPAVIFIVLLLLGKTFVDMKDEYID